MIQMFEIWDRLDREEEAQRIETPWGTANDTEVIQDGVTFVQPPGHSGLVLSESRWSCLPAEVSSAMLDRLYAEEDCEMPIVTALLGIETQRYLERALRTARSFERYTAALPHLERLAQHAE